MTDMTLAIGDVERLAATLEALELGETDRATLRAIFAIAGAATAGEDEVGGFSFSWGGGVGDPLNTGGGLFDTFCCNGQHLNALNQGGAAGAGGES